MDYEANEPDGLPRHVEDMEPDHVVAIERAGYQITGDPNNLGGVLRPAVVVVSFSALRLALRHLWLADAVVQKPFGAAELLGQIALARARHRALVLT